MFDTHARLAARMRCEALSAIRRMLEVSGRLGMMSNAGGLPSADLFDLAALSEASGGVMRDQPEDGYAIRGHHWTRGPS